LIGLVLCSCEERGAGEPQADSGKARDGAYGIKRLALSPGTWAATQTKLLAGDGASLAKLGYAVANHGDTAVAGAYHASVNGVFTGAAYVFAAGGTGWAEQAKLTAADGAWGDLLGAAVSISGDTVALGAPNKDSYTGAGYVFVRSGTAWSQQQKITAGDGVANDSFGSSLSISGERMAVGAAGDDDRGSGSGSVYIFTRSGTAWSQQQKITANDGAAGDHFGAAVAISGAYLVAGAYGDDERGSESGSVYVYHLGGSGWSQQDKLVPMDGLGSDQFGRSVAINGDTLLAGAHKDDDRGSSSGSVYVHLRIGTFWNQQAKLTASDGASGDLFGYGVSVSGDRAVVGAHGVNDKGTYSGAAYVFERFQGSWSQVEKLLASDGAAWDYFGFSAAVSGESVALGAYLDDDKGSDSGSLYLFFKPIAKGGKCTSAKYCASGFCEDGLCCDKACGGAALDCQVCSLAQGATQDGTCTVLSSGVPCRAAAGICDVPEVCDGVSTSCSTDIFKPTTTVCRAAAGPCDVEETCSGAASACPGDVLKSSAAVCRAAAGPCDVEEACDGSATACPADAVKSSATVCRAAAGICDVEEACDGSATSCPADLLKATTVVCRAAMGGCDLKEMCDGSTVACPADALKTSATVCRAAAGPCDVEEACDGSTTACPADAVKASATVCRAAAGACDVQEVCEGSTITCAADAVKSTTAVCRTAAGGCDVEEWCDGTTTACPVDVLKASATVCRAAAGACDVEEACGGTTAACPADILKSTATVCRVSAGDCDLAESCDGATAACPTDSFRSTTTLCRAKKDTDCDLDESCSGTSATCPPDKFTPDGTSCYGGTGTCQNKMCVLKPDARVPDQGVGADLTPDSGPEIVKVDGGCGCEAGGSPGAAPLLSSPILLLALWFWRRPRRETR